MPKVPLVPKVHRVVSLEPRAGQVDKEHKALKEPQVLPKELREFKGLLVPKDKLVRKVYPQEIPEVKEFKGHKVPLVPKAPYKEPQALKVLQEHKVP